ncbi:MAG TPA: hypothetical protein VNH18_16160, partial [Bryobacteraceae bacterium]|nr:hypothetical protein [Bryobacteraceae bacterium]
MSLRPLRQLLLTTLFTVLCTATSQAQLTNVTNATATPTAGVGHDYFKLLDETVDPSSGAVSVRIGVPVPPSRGLTIPFAFTYDSNSYSLQLLQPGQMIWNFNQNLLAYGPWSNTLPTLSAVLVQYQQPGSQPNPCYAGTGYLFQDPSGGRHALGISAIFSSNATPSCSGTHWQNAFTGGDDFFRAAISGVSPTQGANISTSGPGAGEVRIADASGTVYDFAKSTPSNFNSWNCSTNGIQTNTFASAMPTKIEDRNGNVIAISQPCAGSTFAISDTAGRTALSFSATNHTLPSGLQSWKITSATPSGSSLPYQASWTTATSTKPSLNATTVQGPQGCTGVPAWASFQQGVSPDLVSSITLPNGKQYQFTYDPVYGLLSKITYPTGGYVSYSWGLNPQSASATYTTGVPISTCVYIYDRPAVLHRYVSFDGTTIALQQDFSYSTTWSFNVWATKQTTVTTHDLVRGTTFQTVYAYTPVDAPSVPNSRPIISGSQATETFADRQIAVESTVTYQNINGSVLATVTKAWQDQYEMWCEIKTLDNGSYSGTTFGYGPGHVVTDKKEWDFGVLASPNCSSTVQTPPTPTRETVSTYQSFAATPIYSAGPSIFDKPATVITYGNGTRLAETDFSYDQSTVGTVTNLPAGTHDETNYAAASTVPRGNATTVTKQCFQGATACTNSVSTSTFDETGQTLTKVDPCGNSTCADMTGTTHTTTFSYADSFDSPPASNTNAYLTQVTDPLGHTHSFKYAFADGQLISSTDQNNLTTQFLYGDSMRRITETDFPDGGKTTVSYNDAAPTPSVTTSKSINALQSITSVSVSDGIGHPVQSQLTSDPQGTVFIDTAYDGLGRVKSVSNPYRMGSDPTTTTGTTSFVYDSLGRKTSETAQDGSIIATAYCGPNTLATDPTGRWRRSRSDALGHLVEVDEPNAVGATVAATGCPGTGEPIWVTSYSYDALNDLLQVLQNGSHQRTFTYDSLSRMLTSTNPEVGTLTYTYDPNGNVSSKKDARNITTSYTYDVLNRNLTTAYSNGDAGVSIVYDQTNCLGLAACQ